MRKRMNKRGVSDVVTWVITIIGLLILAPIMLLVVNSILDPYQAQVGNITAAAGEGVGTVKDTFITFWDWLIAIAFLVNMILLFVFAFMVESHPIYAFFYFISSVIALMFSKLVMAPVTTIFGMDAFSKEVLQLPITNFIVTRFDLILLGVIIVTGIIMYGKFRSASGFQR